MKRVLILLSIVFIWTCSSPTKSEPAPQPPTVNNLSITTSEDTPTTFTMTGTDPEGAALTFSISTQPQNGTVTASGAAGTYTPNENYNGTDTFAYIASDGALSSQAGLVSVTVTAVDDDPNTMNVSAITDEDNAVEIILEAEEYDGDTISFNIKDNPTSGSVTLNGDKATYTPNENYYGSDSFTFEAVDYTARKVLNTATASITINPINDAPVVEDITVEEWNNKDITISLTGTDVEGDNITFHIVDNPVNVNAAIDGTTLTINKSSSFWGADSLTYYAYDGTSYGETAKVDITFKRYINYNKSSYALRNNELWLDMNSLKFSINNIVEYNYGASMSYGDFNSDGYMDFVISTNKAYSGANPPGTRDPVGLFINDGDNVNFTQKDELILNNVGTEFGRKTLTGDFNGDNIPDAFFADHGYDGTPPNPPFQSIMLSRDDGTFDFKVLSDVRIAYGHGASSADIDNDGDLDVFVTGGSLENTYPTGFFFINDGNGNFTVDYSIVSFQKHGVYTAELVHVNNDPYIDLVIGGGHPHICCGDGNIKSAIILLNDGTNSFHEGSMLEIPNMNVEEGAQYFINDFVFKDLDGDGWKEIFAMNQYFESSSSTQLMYSVQISSYNGSEYTDITDSMIDKYIGDAECCNSGRWRLQDIDNNGRINLITDTKTGHELGVPVTFNWEWNGSKFIAQF